MDGNVLTISLGPWMELPDLDFRAWEAEYCGVAPSSRENRASVSSVATYYHDYVIRKGLMQYFRPGTTVTEIKPADSIYFLDLKSSPCDERDPETGVVKDNNKRPLWEVHGYDDITDKSFHYVTHHVVLATGSTDRRNKLNVPGEQLPFVIHTLCDLEKVITTKQVTPDSDPVLVVGAGLSAADAVIAARFHGLSVVHVFRRAADDPGFIFQQLPENMYPEYHKVHQMMMDGGNSYPGYKALSQHYLVEICDDNKVRIGGPDKSTTVKVSYVISLIGSKPELNFVPYRGTKLGVQQGYLIDSKTNPIRIDPYTHQCVHAPGVYALGPLAGDNFVRFLQGGAMAITSHINKEVQQLEPSYQCQRSESTMS